MLTRVACGSQALSVYRRPVFLICGATTRWSAVAFSRTRRGVALFDSEASATNQALGMSVGRPTGMPAIFGVSAKAWPGSWKPG